MSPWDEAAYVAAHGTFGFAGSGTAAERDASSCISPPRSAHALCRRISACVGRFFYNRDSGLYWALRDAFRLVDQSIADENFLAVFQRAGCYLVDTCRQPVDRMEAGARRAACLAGEALLSRRIRRLQPETIITLVRSISANVERAAARARWTGKMIEVPYPGRWIQHRKVFLENVVPRLYGLMESTKQETES